MAVSTIPKNMTDGSLVINDGTGTPLTITVAWENGDFSFDGLAAGGQRERVPYTSRAKTLIGLRMTGLIYGSYSFSFTFGEFTEATTGNVMDMLLGTGGHSARISTTVALGDVMTFDLIFTVEGTDLGDSADHTFTMTDCTADISFAEGDPTTVTISGTCYGTLVGG